LERLGEYNPIVATGHAPVNGKLCLPGFETYHASDTNIPLRHLEIAKQIGLDAIISVDGDDLFTSPTAVRHVIEALEQGKALVRTEGLPYGFNVLWAYSTKFLEQCLQGPYPEVMDTFWGEIFPREEIHHIKYHFPVNRIRATLDYPTDLMWFRMVIANCPPEILKDDLALTAWLKENSL
jgi:spore coat polysaccharide biosynthesis protein SpsF (cytidylyltransferase family)